MMTPPMPDATHSVALGQLIPRICRVVADVWGDQLLPSMVARTLPLSAIAAQCVVEAQLTALNVSVDPFGVWSFQFVPPSVVLAIFAGPTAKQTLVEGQLLA